MSSFWQTHRLGDVIELQTGFPFKSEHYTDDPVDIRLLRGDNIVPGGLRWDGVKRWSKDATNSYREYLLQVGDIVIAMDRPWINSGLKLARIQDADLPSLLVQRVARIRATSNSSSDFLFQIVGSFDFSQYLLSEQTGSAVPHISAKQIKDYRFPCPPLAEQRKIAQILSTWDEAIALVEALIAALKRRKQGLMQRLLTGEDHGWGLIQLSEVLEQDRDYVTDLEDKLYPRISVKWWAKGAVVDGYDNGLEVKMSRHQLAKAGQVIVSEIWAKHGSIGVIPADGEGALITSHFYLYDHKSDSPVARKFLDALIDANYFMKPADRMSRGTTSYSSIRAQDFLRIEIPLPPAEEQMNMAEGSSLSNELVACYEEYLTRLREQKRGLMQRLLTGEVRVRVE